MGVSVDRQRPGRLAVSSINRWQPGDTVWLSEDYGRTWDDLSPRSRRDTSVSPFLKWGREDTEFGDWTAGLAIDPFHGGTLAYEDPITMPVFSWGTITSIPEDPAQKPLKKKYFLNKFYGYIAVKK